MIPKRTADVRPPPLHRRFIGLNSYFRWLFFRWHVCSPSLFLRPFAPRALPRFLAPMDALTPRRLTSAPGSPCFTHACFPPFRLHTPDAPRRRFLTQPFSAAGFPLFFPLRVWASPLIRRLASAPGRIEFVSYGPAVRLTLLSTPPRGDAVALGFRPECVCLKRTFTVLQACACRRTDRSLVGCS